MDNYGLIKLNVADKKVRITALEVFDADTVIADISYINDSIKPAATIISEVLRRNNFAHVTTHENALRLYYDEIVAFNYDLKAIIQLVNEQITANCDRTLQNSAELMQGLGALFG